MTKAKTIISIAQILIDDSAEGGKIINDGLIRFAVFRAIKLFPDATDEVVTEATDELFRRYKGRIN